MFTQTLEHFSELQAAFVQVPHHPQKREPMQLSSGPTSALPPRFPGGLKEVSATGHAALLLIHRHSSSHAALGRHNFLELNISRVKGSGLDLSEGGQAECHLNFF